MGDRQAVKRKGAGRLRGDDRPRIWTGYGKLLKHFRELAGLTQSELADAVGYSCEQVASIEQGRRPAKAAFTEAAERVLNAGGALLALQEDVDLARLPLFFQDFAAIEAEAVSRFSYDPLLIPGLLQTEEYARALQNAHFPPLDDELVEEHVAGRMARQALIGRKQSPIVFVFIIEETALHRRVGGDAVMRRQLQWLLECAQLRNVEVQIMPTSRVAHSGLNGAMVLLEDLERRQFVYIEAQGVGTVLSDRQQVSEFWLRYGMLRSQALDTEESVLLIQRAAGDL
ncbi:helix-turn-helix transcriptional regulator [Streptomyces sp. TS71-3]|uniref:helix-turn-helix domain-containing protein n=1 Tax=Streptomyces sp. TS71-3 TaxID=2733862 RepID=UPI001B10009C|nr:helix-turn-helix transcriptional regulator [Streptomyces sp. TS71-3]GHJ38421.1 transcriptional regulator [Streptomyces sp. TS71-3]